MFDRLLDCSAGVWKGQSFEFAHQLPNFEEDLLYPQPHLEHFQLKIQN